MDRRFYFVYGIPVRLDTNNVDFFVTLPDIRESLTKYRLYKEEERLLGQEVIEEVVRKLHGTTIEEYFNQILDTVITTNPYLFDANRFNCSCSPQQEMHLHCILGIEIGCVNLNSLTREYNITIGTNIGTWYDLYQKYPQFMDETPGTYFIREYDFS